MITFDRIRNVNSLKPVCDGFCLSTDVKPLETVGNGSSLTEIDTGDVYLFNEAGPTWVKQFSLQGG